MSYNCVGVQGQKQRRVGRQVPWSRSVNRADVQFSSLPYRASYLQIVRRNQPPFRRPPVRLDGTLTHRESGECPPVDTPCFQARREPLTRLPPYLPCLLAGVTDLLTRDRGPVTSEATATAATVEQRVIVIPEWTILRHNAMALKAARNRKEIRSRPAIRHLCFAEKMFYASRCGTAFERSRHCCWHVHHPLFGVIDTFTLTILGHTKSDITCSL
jgi:hypothetical protein